MKRSPELAALSREHHVALELALRLRRARREEAEPLAADAAEFWRLESSEHFRLEEQFLLPRLVRHAGAEDEDVVRTLSDHAELRRRFASVGGGGGDLDALRRLGELLAAHVRFEERVLFPRIESTLDQAELAAVGRELESGRPDR
jgi:hemerythrin-like domain-containing protein